MYLEKVKKLLTRPEEALRKERKTPLFQAFTYFLFLNFFYSIIGGTMVALVYNSERLFWITSFSLYGAMIMAAFLGSAILHASSVLMGAKKGLGQTMKAVFFGMTPTLLFGWIPGIGIFFGFWSLVLEVLGLKNLHGIKSGAALGSVILAVAMIFVLLVLIAFGSLVSTAGYGSLGAPGIAGNLFAKV